MSNYRSKFDQEEDELDVKAKLNLERANLLKQQMIHDMNGVVMNKHNRIKPFGKSGSVASLPLEPKTERSSKLQAETSRPFTSLEQSAPNLVSVHRFDTSEFKIKDLKSVHFEPNTKPGAPGAVSPVKVTDPSNPIFEIKENKGIFFNKIKHFSRSFNPKEKSQILFKEISSKVEDFESKQVQTDRPHLAKININSYKQEINQRIATFTAFAISNSGSLKHNRMLSSEVKRVQGQAKIDEGKSNAKPMGVVDLWSTTYHAEVMSKAEHQKFRLRIQRYLHLLHRQGMGHNSISRLMLESYQSSLNKA